jgi:outer membrane protein OmpA-like peptidoglycan-associated protein
MKLRLGLSAVIFALFLVPAANSVADTTAEQLIEKLSGHGSSESAPVRRTRSFGGSLQASQNAHNVDEAKCDIEQFPTNLEIDTTSSSRALYVTDAPSVDLQVQFELDSSKLQKSAEDLLLNLATALRSDALKTHSFIVAGHTDASGQSDYNRRLSCARANSVARFLIEEGRINPNRLSLLGFGFTQLKDSTNPMAEINRRVEIKRAVNN